MQEDFFQPIPLTKSQRQRRKRKQKREKFLADVAAGRRVDKVQVRKEVQQLLQYSRKEQQEAHKAYVDWKFLSLIAEDEAAADSHRKSTVLAMKAFKHLQSAANWAGTQEWMPNVDKFVREVKDGRIFSLPEHPLTIHFD